MPSSSKTKYYLIAGEASGDLHGSNLIKAMTSMQPGAQFRGWGGEKMEAAGMHLIKHYRETAFMGFVEVIKHLPSILGFLKQAKNDILAWQPDAVILIDYPGFNLRMASWLHARGIDVHYYISPQVWAWKAARVHKLNKFAKEIICILPFEKDFYKKYGIDVHYVGHPLLDEIPEHHMESPRTTLGKICLLPGSREQEIGKLLPDMIAAALEIKPDKISIAGVNHIDRKVYESLTQHVTEIPIEIKYGNTYELLSSSDTAIVASGTATLETALLGVPQVVVYRGNNISYRIAKKLVKLKYISLVNLILDRPAVKELIQEDCTVENIVNELKNLSSNASKMQADYRDLRIILGNAGASQKAAEIILTYPSS